MLFCSAEEMRVSLFYWADILALIPQHFIIAPLIRTCDKTKYKATISQLSKLNKNVAINPVYLKSETSSFRNLMFLNVLLGDSISIFKAVNRSKPDCIICFYVTHAYPLLLLKRIFKFYLCVYAMGSDINLENDLLHRIIKKITYNNCERIFAFSEKLKLRIEKESGYKATVIPSSADSAFFKPMHSKVTLRRKWKLRPEIKVILTISRLDKQKGVDILIKSLKTLNPDEVSLLIRGDGPERNSLERLATSLGIKESVRFLGFLNRNELLELYNLSDLFALTSYSEGLPRVLIEAMACGCIPIVTDVGDVTTVVRDEFNGFVVSPGDHEKLGAKIKQILSLPEESKKIIQNRARDTVEAEFDTKKTIRRIVQNVNALVGEPRLSAVTASNLSNAQENQQAEGNYK